MSRKQKRVYRSWLTFAVVAAVIVLIFVFLKHWNQRIPGEVRLYKNQQEQLNFLLPFGEGTIKGSSGKIISTLSVNNRKIKKNKISFSMDKPVVLSATQEGTFQAEVKLFGWLHYKYITFDVTKKARVMPVGKAVGLYIESNGLMVLGTGKIMGKDGIEKTPAKDILQSGDYITSINGVGVNQIDQVANLLQDNGSKKLVLTVRRGKNRISVKIQPVETGDGTWQMGAWLREDTEGIGTLTFVTEKNQFAALGHGITDIDTGLLIDIQNGGLYPARVSRVNKGKNGSPGELSGTVKLGEQNKLGVISHNTKLGISGKITNPDFMFQKSQSIPMGRKQDVKKGDAVILCQLGDLVKSYHVSIENINFSSTDNKGMEIHVTDKKLLQDSGGIVQGMSGAPVIQNGRCIGAVTHVFVQDVTRGYATFIENML